MGEEERKSQLAQPRAEACEVCGALYYDKEEQEKHLKYKVHESFVKIKNTLDELKEKRAAREKAEKEAREAKAKEREAKAKEKEDKKREKKEEKKEEKRRAKEEG